MNHHQPDDLYRELFHDEATGAAREQSLAAGLTALRQKRRTRRMQVTALATLPALLAASLWTYHAQADHSDTAAVKIASSAAVRPSQPVIALPPIEKISDDELLALLQNENIALIGTPGHQELVVFDAAAPGV